MFSLCSKITVGVATLEGIYEVNIKRSIKELAATAVIKVPEKAMVRISETEKEYVYLAKHFKVGNFVRIELGYNGSYNLEFVGFVVQINQQSPLEIVCEDYFYRTRQTNLTFHKGRGEIMTLDYLLGHLGVPLGYVDNFDLKFFPVDNKPAAWVLNKVKEDYGLNIYFGLDGCINAYQYNRLTSKVPKYYNLSRNVIDYRDLKFQREEDVDLRIKAVCVYKNGKTETITVGSETGAERVIYYYDVESADEARGLAENELARYRFNGFTGKIVTFLSPYALPGQIAVFMDYNFLDRTGAYFIEGTEVTFGRNGARRIVELGAKVQMDDLGI